MATISAQQFLGGKPATVIGNETTPEHRKSYLSRIGSTIKESVKEGAESLTKSGEGTMNPFAAGANIAKNVTKAVASPILEAPIIKQIGEGFGKIGEFSQKGGKYNVLNKITDFVGENVSPEVLGGASDILETAGNMFAIEGGIQGVKSLPKVFEKGTDILKSGIDKGGNEVSNFLKKAQEAKQGMLEKNVDPRLKTSATRSESPLKKYESFLEQEKRAKVDVKQDSALSQVGEKIGDSFEKVVKDRKKVGETMGTELEKIGGQKVNVAEPVRKFIDNVSKEGLKYDSETKMFTSEGQTKMTSVDKSILSDFAGELERLGDAEVTIKDLDAFVSRVSKDLDLYKSKNNIIGTTNAERIIKNTLSDFRESFNPEISKNESFRPYYEARKQYAEMSNFLEEGQSYLGKKTQSGDFAKDASIAKSSVQSLLNSGKKDWLARLEELTGYSALDDSVLALQAMTDMGNPKGASLLQLISEGDIPTTKMGIVNKILDKVAGATREKILGTPEQQTRSFLSSLDKKSSLPTEINEFVNMKPGEKITNPESSISIGDKAKFTRKSFKHFIESRLKDGNTTEDINYLVEKAPEVVSDPELNIKNPVQKYKDSSLLGRFYPESNKAVMVVLDKGGEVRDIVSLHFSKRSDFDNLMKLYGQK